MDKIADQTSGRWRNLLPRLGIHERYLSGKHGPCPMCGGTDRWRFDDKAGRGTWFCSHCGAGDGIELVKRINRVEFREARQMILRELPAAHVALPERETYDYSAFGKELWQRSAPLNGDNASSLYLKRRHVWLDEPPTQIRHVDGVKCEGERYSALIAQFVGPDASERTYQLTYLTEDGQKAGVQPPRKTMGKMPSGGAVRLFPSSDTLGIAEGVETAIAAHLLHGVPVWATFSCAALMKWQPPPNAENILIFGDHDASFTGQHGAYALAYRLKGDGVNCEVRLPELEGDWADVLEMEQR